MIETITSHKFNDFEHEIVGYLFSEISKKSVTAAIFCPIYDSLIDFGSAKHHQYDELTEYSERKRPISIMNKDLYGLFTLSEQRKTKTIIICVGKLRDDFKRVESNLYETIVLLHELGHYISYAVPFGSIKSVSIGDPSAYVEDKKFQELWAQMFTYKVLTDVALNKSGQFSTKSVRAARKCKKLMIKLSKNQGSIYRSYESVFGQEIAHFLGNNRKFCAYAHIPLSLMLVNLGRTRKTISYKNNFTEIFLHQLSLSDGEKLDGAITFDTILVAGQRIETKIIDNTIFIDSYCGDKKNGYPFSITFPNDDSSNEVDYSGKILQITQGMGMLPVGQNDDDIIEGHLAAFRQAKMARPVIIL